MDIISREVAEADTLELSILYRGLLASGYKDILQKSLDTMNSAFATYAKSVEMRDDLTDEDLEQLLTYLMEQDLKFQAYIAMAQNEAEIAIEAIKNIS